MKEKWASKDHVTKGDENRPLKTRATRQPGLSELSCSNSPLCPVSRCHLLPPSELLQQELALPGLGDVAANTLPSPIAGTAHAQAVPRSAAGRAHPAVPAWVLSCPPRGSPGTEVWHGSSVGSLCFVSAAKSPVRQLLQKNRRRAGPQHTPLPSPPLVDGTRAPRRACACPPGC